MILGWIQVGLARRAGRSGKGALGGEAGGVRRVGRRLRFGLSGPVANRRSQRMVGFCCGMAVDMHR